MCVQTRPSTSLPAANQLATGKGAADNCACACNPAAGQGRWSRQSRIPASTTRRRNSRRPSGKRSTGHSTSSPSAERATQGYWRRNRPGKVEQMTITYTDASIFDLDVEALVNPVNCVGVSARTCARVRSPPSCTPCPSGLSSQRAISRLEGYILSVTHASSI